MTLCSVWGSVLGTRLVVICKRLLIRAFTELFPLSPKRNVALFATRSLYAHPEFQELEVSISKMAQAVAVMETNLAIMIQENLI